MNALADRKWQCTCVPRLRIFCTALNKGAIGPKGVKGGSPRRSPEGYFGRNRRIWLETAQPTRQKAIQGLLSHFRWSPGPSIFDGFLADLNRALSALFSKIRPQKIENPPSPGGPLGLQMSNVGLRGSKEGSRMIPEQKGSSMLGASSRMLGAWLRIGRKLLQEVLVLAPIF